MKTYEEWLAVGQGEKERLQFVKSAINDYQASEMYRKANTGYDYFRRRNTTIINFQKFLYEQSGKAVPDNYSANYKFRNAFFPLFVRQEVSHLLGNGVTFQKDDTKEKLGGDMFDTQLYRALQAARCQAVAYGFFNKDRVEIFKAREFVPFWGEEDGMLHAGVRFWQLAPKKPLRVTLMEEDGVTEIVYSNGEGKIIKDKTPYITVIRRSDAAGVEIAGGKNYPKLPVVPLWGNEEHQTALEGLQEKIDGYDLIQSGLANDLDEASYIYWLITNAGGMDDVDLAKFVRDMKLLHAGIVDENGSVATAHTMDVPFEARSAGLEEIRTSLFRDAMALDTDKISSGNVTATAIRASYEALDLKCDAIEMCVTEFINGLLELIGVDDMPNYKRSRIVNMQDETETVLSAAQYLDTETILKHLPFLSPDEIDGILERMTREEAERYVGGKSDTGIDDTEGGNRANAE